MELIFQELDEIFRLPMKFLDPPSQRVNTLLTFKTILTAKIVKTQCYYLNYDQTITKLNYNTDPLIITFITKPK